MALISYLLIICQLCLVAHVDAQCTSTNKQGTENLEGVYTLQSFSNPGEAYFPSMDCKWVIDSGDPTVQVFVDLTKYFIEVGPGCTYDSLIVYDGAAITDPVLATLCGNSFDGRTFESSGRYITFRLRSDFSVQYAGFTAEYMAGSDESGTGCTSTQNISISMPNITYLSSSGFPGSIGASSCSWRIFPGSNPLNNVTVQILFTDVAESENCQTDSLKIYEGNDATGTLLATFCDGRQRFPGTAQTVLIANQAMFITFDSQVASTTRHGFFLSINETESGFTTPAPPTTTQAPVQECGTVTLTASSTIQHIVSQSYPVFYSNNLDCTWLIQAPSGYDIQLMFLDFFIEDSEGCVADSLLIYDGDTTEYPVIGTFCGEIFNDVNSTSNSLLLKFKTDQSYTERGFYISYESISHDTPSCVSAGVTTINLNASSTVQYFTSAGYPNNYASSSTTQWLIYNPTESGDILIEVVDSRIEASKDCIYDKVTIYKGPCLTYPVLGSFCGPMESKYYQDAGTYALIVFTTDINVEFRGFNITYVIGEAPTPFPLLFLIGLVIGPILAIVVLSFVIFGAIKAYRKYKGSKKSKVGDRNLIDDKPGTSTALELPPLPEATDKVPLIDADLLYNTGEVKVPEKKRKIFGKKSKKI